MDEVLRPSDEAELAEIVRAANAPLAVRGGGTRGPDGEGTALTVAGLRGIEAYEPGALTMVVRAGTPLAEVEAALAAEGQRLAFEPYDARGLMEREGEPTIGAVAAANVSGPRRVQAGAARDCLLGVRFVDGTGRIVRNGGRVMKNVTGYDLVRLMAGAGGTLGVLTEVALKVLPDVETEATLVLDGITPGRAVEAMAAALGSPFEISGAAADPAGRRCWLRIEGFAGSVAYRAGRLAESLARFGEVERVGDREDSRAIWRGIRDVAALQGRPGDVWRLSVQPSAAPGILERAGAEAAMMDWGGGRLWLLLEEGTDLRARLGAFPGHATLVRAAREVHERLGTHQPEAPAVAALAAGLRARFDPRGILNPGRMG